MALNSHLTNCSSFYYLTILTAILVVSCHLVAVHKMRGSLERYTLGKKYPATLANFPVFQGQEARSVSLQILTPQTSGQLSSGLSCSLQCAGKISFSQYARNWHCLRENNKDLLNVYFVSGTLNFIFFQSSEYSQKYSKQHAMDLLLSEILNMHLLFDLKKLQPITSLSLHFLFSSSSSSV